MWRGEAENQGRHGYGGPHGDSDRNMRAVLAVALVAALALALSSTLPLPLVPATLEIFLFYGAVGGAILAVFRGDDPRAGHFTAWDQALMLMFLSQLAGLFVDAEAVREMMASPDWPAHLTRG